MKTDTPLEYMCPYCGAFNEFSEDTIRDMYQEQVETCGCCKKNLSLTAAALKAVFCWPKQLSFFLSN